MQLDCLREYTTLLPGVAETIQTLQGEAESLLRELICIPSLTGNEQAAIALVKGAACGDGVSTEEFPDGDSARGSVEDTLCGLQAPRPSGGVCANQGPTELAATTTAP